MENLTPMMRQYFDIKEKYKDCILFFRLGDFYEMFFDYALLASRELEITLTGRDCGQKERAPMCGVPHHAAETYISKLINKGYKVAICEQTEDPAAAKGIVKRDVIRTITPGTVVNPDMLNEKENNFLLSLYMDQEGAAIAYSDISTGEIKASECSETGFESKIINEIAKIRPKEIIVNEFLRYEKLLAEIKAFPDSFADILENRYFEEASSLEAVMQQLKVKSVKGLGLEDKVHALKALGALLVYLTETQKNNLTHLNNLHIYDSNHHMSIDKATLKSLEITETVFDKKIQGSLLGVLDKTSTAMGGRKLKQWLREPLNTLPEIQARLDAVEVLYNDILIRNNIKESLKRIYDLERLSGRIACGNANARDLIALRNSLSVIPEIKSDLASLDSGLINTLNDEIDPVRGVYDLIDKAVVEDPPYTIKEGGIIQNGYNEELDHIKMSIHDGTQWIANLENSEKERTGIKSLKVGFNKVFGYYIEVTKSYYDLVPDNYIRKQTLANAERFITPELKEVESVVLNAETKINQLEYEIFLEIRNYIQDYIERIQKTAQAIAQLDVLVSFAEVSEKLNYVKPVVNNSNVIEISKGRHPVIEQTIKNGIFVSNDTYIDDFENSLLLITGPNMAGKSTYMRQTALIVLMAQIGCFVPADHAEIGIVDRIYTRIGASDNLSQGQSTFLVEMSELAYILNTATEKSLVILDEIGRGTSTYDGLSIAWAVVEYLCSKEKRIKTLFATHYHELTKLEGQISGFKNLNVDVKEDNEEVIFLHKIVEGCANKSYGIHVARLAGVPDELLSAADEKLVELENQGSEIHIKTDRTQKIPQEHQISLFEIAPNPIVEKIKNVDLLNITPLQALNILESLKKEALKAGK